MPTVTDSDIRDALSAIRDVEPTDADVRRATIAARPQPRVPRPRSSGLAGAAIAAGAAVAAVAVLPSSSSERASVQDVLLDAAAVGGEQPAMRPMATGTPSLSVARRALRWSLAARAASVR